MRTNNENGRWLTYNEMDAWDQMVYRAREGWKWFDKRRRKKIGMRGRVYYEWEYFIEYRSDNKPQLSFDFSD